jgi:hypothetical protein
VTFTFNAALTTARDRVRMRLGDIEEKRPIFPDETIDYVLANVTTDEAHAAWDLCKFAIAQYSRDVNSEGAGLRAERAQKVTQLRDLCAVLEREVMASARPVFTGSSVAVTRKLLEDEDFTGFGTRIGKSNYPGIHSK